MNKKFITLCVSALLAGGMVTPAFAQVSPSNITKGMEKVALTNWGDPSNNWGIDVFEDGVYYRIALNTTAANIDYNNFTLQATKAGVSAEQVAGDVTVYNLWKVEKVKSNGNNTGAFKLVNMAGLYLGVEDDGSVVPNGKYQEFTTTNNGTPSSYHTIALANDQLQYQCLTYNGGTLKFQATADCEVAFYTPAVDELSVSELNDKFLSSFTIGVGYYDENKEWKNYATEHDLKGNVFAGDLKADNNIGTNYDWSQDLDQTTGIDNEVYLWNGDKIVVLTNAQWSNLNNSLNEVTGYKFQLMTPEELAIQESKDKADPKHAVIRSYVFKVTSPNVVSDEALEVAVKVYDYDTEAFTGWEELYVSEVDDNYYLTTAKAANNEPAPNAGDEDTRLWLQKADYANATNQVYVRFTENNFVDAEHFFGYAWNIVRLNDSKAIHPQATEWVDAKTIGVTVPEGQWILAENANKDGYEWTNRETTVTAGAKIDGVDFAFNQLRETNENDEYNGVDIYRIGEGDDAKYYEIKIAKNAAGEDVNLETAWDEFDYYGADVKSNSAGVDNTYKIQFTSNLTGEPIYIGMDGVGVLNLTTDPTAAVSFEADTMKTTDKAVIVYDEDYDAYNDVFHILNTYIGKDEDGKWVDKTDSLSFYRYNFMHDGKFLKFNANDNKFELIPFGAEDANGDEIIPDAFVIKEKGDNYVNILNVNNADFDEYLEDESSNNHKTIVDFDEDGKFVRVSGEDLLAARSTQMMYFDFNFAEARQQQNIYDWNANAQLKLDYKNYDMYRNVAPTAPDTMAIYRTEFDDEFMYERGEFLGVTYDRNGYNAALFIDTAYVRNNTEKPLFMIGVRPEITPEYVYCPEHGPNAGCPSQHLDTIPGYVDADYLTVLADSAAYHAAELQNPFLDDNAYTKLAFIAARHNVDTITVADSGAKATIVEGMQHPMVFAFRYVDHETGDFIIEGVNLKNNKKEFDAKENPYVTSYIRWNNGVPVMTENINDAEVFNITNLDETADPTANETIAAEGAVSVVATEGGVIVKGAEGKNVVVATILGKVVANETVNSDNETINTPAGIVVVSVDGESFKVVVK